MLIFTTRFHAITPKIYYAPWKTHSPSKCKTGFKLHSNMQRLSILLDYILHIATTSFFHMSPSHSGESHLRTIVSPCIKNPHLHLIPHFHIHNRFTFFSTIHRYIVSITCTYRISGCCIEISRTVTPFRFSLPVRVCWKSSSTLLPIGNSANPR